VTDAAIAEHAADLALAGHHHHDAEVRESRELGFWFYLMSDAVIFSLLFATYASMNGNTAGGPGAKDVFDLGHTLVETALLLGSSLTCGFAVIAAKREQTGNAVAWLLLTLALGLGFVGMEAVEFGAMIARGAGPDRSGFLSSFFTLVGTHGLHVSFGSLWLLVMIGQLLVKGPNPWVLSRLQRWGVFWHFLDIVWIGIFSVVYLPGVM
jgi:cytochrome o ubiquinol oxidase subunit 3